MSNFFKVVQWLFVIVCISSLMAQAQAGLLVYEPFNGYDADNNGNLVGENPNGYTVGLDQTVAYAMTSGYGAENLVAGLTFGNLVTAGSAERVYSSGIAASTSTHVAAKLTSTVSGTLYGSYLVSIPSFSSDYASFAALTVDDTGTSNTTPRFYSEADGKTSTNAPGVRYASGSEGVASTALSVNTTYLVLSKFTNVGELLTQGDPGVAELWALTLTDFAGFVQSGLSESWLDANVANKATVSQESGTYDFASGDYLRMTCYHKGGSLEQAIFDEIRYGDSWAIVTPIPEPSALAILAIACGLVAAYACRRRKRG